jgi:hypothetical protein
MKEKVKIDKKLQNKKKLSSALKQNLLRRKATFCYPREGGDPLVRAGDEVDPRLRGDDKRNGDGKRSGDEKRSGDGKRK